MTTEVENLALRAALKAALRWLEQDTVLYVRDPSRMTGKDFHDGFQADVYAMHAGWKLLGGKS